jgi:hypothetical protein
MPTELQIPSLPEAPGLTKRNHGDSLWSKAERLTLLEIGRNRRTSPTGAGVQMPNAWMERNFRPVQRHQRHCFVFAKPGFHPQDRLRPPSTVRLAPAAQPITASPGPSFTDTEGRG